MAKLILHSEGAPQEFPVKGELIIGRHSSCTIPLDEPKASRRHLRITPCTDGFEIEDLESSNGTKVNGKRISRQPLSHGDTIQIGATRLLFDAPEFTGRPAVPIRNEAPPRLNRTTDDPLVGTTLGGFKLLAKIGQGGMGTVFEALQISLDRKVAVKVLNPELARDRSFAKEFIHEARAAGRFTHPGLVEIHDVNETNGILYYAMELVDGESAMELVKRKGKIELAQALDIGIGVADVLVQLEKADAVHQDIKPHNILLQKDGKVKLTDFGLATVGGRIRRTVPNPDGILGTPHYMSPEQASRTKRVTPKADIYSLGCTLFHLLTGKVPFDGTSALVVLAKHANQIRPDAHQLNDDVPEVLATLLSCMMAIEPDERPAGPQEVLDTLKRVKTGLTRTAGVQPIRPGPSGGSRRRPAEDTRASGVLSGMDPVAARVIQIGVIAVMLVLGFQLACLAVANLDPNAGRGATAPLPPPARVTEKKDDPVPVKGHVKQTPTAHDTGAPDSHPSSEVTPEVESAFKAALEKRDRALLSGNLSGARLAIVEFRRANPDGEIAQRAMQAFEDTQKEITAVCEQIFKEAATSAAKKNFRLTAAKCTRLISADPRSAFADRARALMGRVDLETQERFEEIRSAAHKELAQGRLSEAARVVASALDELGGTKWTEPLLSEQLNIILADKFLKEMEAARQSMAQASRPVSIFVPDLDGRKQSGILRTIQGLTLKTELKGVTMSYSFDKMTPAEVRLLVAALGLGEQHLGLSNLFSVLNEKTEAQQEFEAAMRVPEQMAEIERLSLRQSGVANLHRYDFSKWEHQSDWEAPSGAWSTKDDQYVLESTDGGDTFLKPDAIGGAFPARNARISFDLSPGQRNDGYYISAEFGDDRRNISLLFTATGWELQIAADESTKTRGTWSIGPTKIEISIDDKDELTLTLNGKPENPVQVKGLSNLKGTLSFHARETACAFDNILLRTMQ